MEKSTSGRSLDLPKNFKPQCEDEHEFYNQKLDSICARCGKDPNSLPDFHLNEPTHERLFIGVILVEQGSRRLETNDNEEKLPKNTRLDTVRATTSAITERTQRCMQYAIMSGLETFCWSRITLLSDPAAKLIRIKVHVVLRFYFVWWSLETRSIR